MLSLERKFERIEMRNGPRPGSGKELHARTIINDTIQ
jgi:hypothetical protein